MKQPFVSVIIPILDDYHRLRLCLDGLTIQTYPADRFEVIVVDNGTDLASYVDVRRRKSSQIRQLREKQPGSYAARNHGLSQAEGEIIAFTDADCIPEPSWLQAGVEAVLSAKRIGLVAGAIEVFAASSGRPTPVEFFEMERAFPQKWYAETRNFGATANVFTKASVIASVGSFDASLCSGGDQEWGRRVAEAGFDVVYAPTARVRHPARRTLDELHAKLWRTLRGTHKLQWQETSWLRRGVRLGELARNSLPPIRFIARTAMQRRPLSERAAIIAVRCYSLYQSQYIHLRLIVEDLVHGMD
jgi:glycosyltransferase involved in cell wall biosynthesis